jgi:hypothetical protein
MVTNGATLICDACAEAAALLIGRTLRPRKPHRVQHMVNMVFWPQGRPKAVVEPSG